MASVGDALVGPATPDTADPSQKNKVPPQVAAAPTRGGAAPTANLMTQWNDWLANPQNKNMMMQFGVDMLQPPSAGQSTLGQIGAAAGDAMATKDAAQKENQQLALQRETAAREQMTAESEAALRSAQSGYFSQRGQSLGDTTGVRGQAVQVNLLGKLEAAIQNETNAMQIAATPDEVAQHQANIKTYQDHYNEILATTQASGAAGAAGAPAPTTAGAASPVPTNLPPKPPGMTEAIALANARTAITRGKDPKYVAATLSSWGFDPNKLAVGP